VTTEEWLTIKVGDAIVTARGGLRRIVLAVSRVSGKSGQRGKIRTVVTVVHSRRPGKTMTIASSDDHEHNRFLLEPS
jgi:hypothetical protein